jgi:hypothetical protein
MLDVVFNALLSWIGTPKRSEHTKTVALAVGGPIFGLFGILLAAAGWHFIWDSGWSPNRIEGLTMFVVGIALIADVATSIVRFRRSNSKAK